ncbi:hypothetical protein LWF01_17550 [Saxibacter everestensis]|uniref:Helix-turn-helix domain-containing protein n=1 Tax=Saxibacter everestensis TaxID=2909229 RepID=A0ABY8QUL0_9MICO|nr:hypothetical protein LWF01_17550 [Brevibacteriaceae bacterium ZFBP1038]
MPRTKIRGQLGGERAVAIRLAEILRGFRLAGDPDGSPITQAEAAVRIGIARYTLQRLERCAGKDGDPYEYPTYATLVGAAEHLGRRFVVR